MAEEQVWKRIREEAKDTPAVQRTGALNAALLFGLAAIAFAMIVTPMVSGPTRETLFADSAEPAYDNIVTGSVKKSSGTKEYVVRRSITQEMPGVPCIIDGDGSSDSC